MRTTTSVTGVDYRRQRLDELTGHVTNLKSISERLETLKGTVGKGQVKVSLENVPAVPNDLTGNGTKDFHLQAKVLVGSDSAKFITNIKRLTEIFETLKKLQSDLAETKARIIRSMKSGSDTLPSSAKENAFLSVVEEAKIHKIDSLGQDLAELRTSIQKARDITERFDHTEVQKAADALNRPHKYAELSKSKAEHTAKTGKGHMEKVSKRIGDALPVIENIARRIEADIGSLGTTVQNITLAASEFSTYNEVRINATTSSVA